MRLSILNLFSSPHEVLALAEMCDRHPCFDRFWVGEHHSSEQVPDPLALAFVLGGITERIRIGTGATSLYYRNPYMVAETALMLELLYPGRLDLGVTKAAAANEHTAAYLTDGLDMQHIMDTYDSRVRLVRDVLRRERAGASSSDQMVPAGPAMFLMGTSEDRARSAGRLGIGFVASFHHGGSPDAIARQIQVYRAAFEPAASMTAPHAIAVMSGFVAKDPAQIDLARSQFGSGRREGLASREATLIFDVPRVAVHSLRMLASAVGADEVMFLCTSRSCLRCYTDLAEAWTDPASTV
jgi:alkanesulfonate monooxygenase SsuD/methylene tetrahydromethanopterin reductase-like flavin-dependent oxidoreductase (luciferase family)